MPPRLSILTHVRFARSSFSFAGVWSFAGSMSLDHKCGNSIHQNRMCNPSRPIHVVQLHGKGDTVVEFGGGSTYPLAVLLNPAVLFSGVEVNDLEYPSAVETFEMWSGHNGCNPRNEAYGDEAFLDSLTTKYLDLRDELGTNETQWVEARGCDQGGSAALGVVVGGDHSLRLSIRHLKALTHWMMSSPLRPNSTMAPTPLDGVGSGIPSKCPATSSPTMVPTTLTMAPTGIPTALHRSAAPTPILGGGDGERGEGNSGDIRLSAIQFLSIGGLLFVVLVGFLGCWRCRARLTMKTKTSMEVNSHSAVNSTGTGEVGGGEASL